MFCMITGDKMFLLFCAGNYRTQDAVRTPVMPVKKTDQLVEHVEAK
jgi:hypothetical protein